GIEIAVGRPRPTDAHSLVGETGGHCLSVRCGMPDDTLQTRFMRGTDHAYGDLASIRHEQLLHRAYCTLRTTKGCPFSTTAPSSTRIASTRPADPALIEWKSFITSTRQTVSSGWTVSPTETNGSAPGSLAR